MTQTSTKEWLAGLAAHLLTLAGARREQFGADFLRSLTRASWPGNVRELRNHLECCLVFGKPLPLPEEIREPSPGPSIPLDLDLPYSVARARCIAEFERAFAGEALRRSGGNIARAVSVARVNRAHLWRIVKRAGGR